MVASAKMGRADCKSGGRHSISKKFDKSPHGTVGPSAFGDGFCTDNYVGPAVSFHWLLQCDLDAFRFGKSGDFIFTLYLCNGIFQWNLFDEMYLHTTFAVGIFTLQLCWLQMNSSTKRWDIRCSHRLISGSPPWSQKAE